MPRYKIGEADTELLKLGQLSDRSLAPESTTYKSGPSRTPKSPLRCKTLLAGSIVYDPLAGTSMSLKLPVISAAATAVGVADGAGGNVG